MARRPNEATFAAFEVAISPRGYVNWHYHDDCELVVVTSGSGTRFIGDSIEEYRGGEVVLIGSGLPHTWCPARGVDSGGAAEVLHIDRSALTWPELHEITKLLDAADRGLLFPTETAEKIRDQMSNARHGSRNAQAISVMAILTELVALAPHARPLSQRAFHRRHRPAGPRETNAALRLEAIRDIVANGFEQHLVQADAARNVGMAPAAFCRFFRRNTGRTFTRYVQEVRLSEASRQLTETDLPVVAIASNVGFGSLAHFNRCFKRHKGVTPTEWRRSVQALAENAAPAANSKPSSADR